LGTLVGIIINVLLNQKSIIYFVIGSVVILLTGTLACFVIYYPFYFRSFHNLIISLVLAGVFIMAIYIGLRLIVNTIMISNDHPSFAAEGAGDMKLIEKARPQIVKQKRHKHKKTIGTVEVTRLDKKNLLINKARNSISSNKLNGNTYSETVLSGHNTPTAEHTPRPLYGNSFLDVDSRAKEVLVSQPEVADVVPTSITEKVTSAQPEHVSSETSGIAASLTTEQATSTRPDAASGESDHDFMAAIVSEEQQSPQPEPASADASDIAASLTAEELTSTRPDAASGESDHDVMAATVSEEQQSPQPEPVSAEPSNPPPKVVQADKYASLIDKAAELVEYGKYIYAAQLLHLSLSSLTDGMLTKRADIMLLECYVMSGQFEQAQKKWLEVLNKMYILEPADKLQLKEILIKLNSHNKQVS
jgi:hypothetical protein